MILIIFKYLLSGTISHDSKHCSYFSLVSGMIQKTLCHSELNDKAFLIGMTGR